MRFAADTKALATALAAAFAATSNRPANPILRSVRMVADPGGLSLCGTDQEVAVTLSAPATVAREGECLLPPRFLSALREYDGSVAVEATDRGIRAHFAKPGQETPDTLDYPLEDPADFPGPPDPPGTVTRTIGADALGDAIDKSAFAAARDEGKYAMRGVLWDLGPDGSCLVATDGKRLAVADFAATGTSAPPALIPPKAMELVRRLCRDGDRISVSLCLNEAYFAAPGGTVYTRLVEGRFPPWRDVLKDKSTTTVTLNGPAFLADVRRAALATDDESKRVVFEFTDGGVSMKAQGASVGSAAVRHAPIAFEGRPVTIAFDPAYLLDAKAPLAGDVTLSLAGPDRSAVFRSAGSLYLVVPLV